LDIAEVFKPVIIDRVIFKVITVPLKSKRVL